jgi:tetratricopeptide (TPR) repeat protein
LFRIIALFLDRPQSTPLLEIDSAAMRLLHLGDFGELLQTEFHGNNIPPYAILSHRWGNAEVLFEDIGGETYKEKEGRRKLEFCAKRASQDGLRYFWSDTCCIDKWNLNELSKSINSMFRYYRDAERCYAYLSDVSVSTAKEVLHQSDWEASFRMSKWFTRGWTLQELIAPTSVDFFTCEGRWIGDRVSLEQLVHDITSIPISALRNSPLDQFTRPERMKWVESRETTEPEDIVYCLLGILDVSMPTTYGEGKEKASMRLRAEMEATDNAPSVIPWSQNDHFVGQESQLTELQAKLFSEKKTTTLAIVGSGGTGKSQLALELAYRTRKRYKDCSIFWVDASDRTSIYLSLVSIAQKLDIPGWKEQTADIMELTKLYLSSGKRQCLFICDNMNSAAAEILAAEYLPESELCSVVFTTTSKGIAERLALQNILELRELTPDAAQRMLEHYLSTLINGYDKHEADILLQELSYLPLAIVQAAAYITARGLTLQQYRLRLSGPEKQEYGSQLTATTENPVARTLFVSLEQIRVENTLAADYLFLAASIDRKDIPLKLLEVSSYEEGEAALKVLNRYALITRRPAESAFEVHGLVHSALCGWLEEHQQLDQWTQHAVQRLFPMLPEPEDRNKSKWTRFIPHVKHALSRCNFNPESECWQMLVLMSRYGFALSGDGQYREAEQLFLQLLEMARRIDFGEEERHILHIKFELSICYSQQGKWDEAEELQLRVLEICSRVLSDEDPIMLNGMSNLTTMYLKQQRYGEAEELQERHVRLCTRVLGDEHVETLNSISKLSITYLAQERWKDAERLKLHVKEIRERVLGEDHPDTLDAIAGLATTYSMQGQWKEAEKLKLHVLETKKRLLGDEHSDTLISMAGLAEMYAGQRRWNKARKLRSALWKTNKKLLGIEHPESLAALADLMHVYSGQGRWQETEIVNKELWGIRRRVLGEGHPDTLASMRTFAANLKVLQKCGEAIQLMEECCQLHKHYLGEKYHATKFSLQLLAEWHEDERIDLVLTIARKARSGKM